MRTKIATSIINVSAREEIKSKYGIKSPKSKPKPPNI